MCAELKSEFQALLGALPGDRVAAYRTHAAVGRVERWSWRRAQSGIEYEELLRAQRERLVADEEFLGEPPAGLAVDTIGRDASGAVAYARLSGRWGHARGELSRERHGDLSTSLVKGSERLELAHGRWEGNTLVEVRRVWRSLESGHEFARERYTHRAGRLVLIARTQGTMSG